MSLPEILFVTSNVNKLKEVKVLLSSVKNYTLNNSDLDLEEIQDSSLQQIAAKKLQQAVSVLPKGTPVFVEDTALGFNAMGGLPGAYIKWFLKKMSLDDLVKLLDGFKDKTGEAITTIAYSDKNGETHIFQGVTKGTIVNKKGSLEFGWDAIFQPLFEEGNTALLTYGEMEKTVKNKISHRGKAFKSFEEYLLNN